MGRNGYTNAAIRPPTLDVVETRYGLVVLVETQTIPSNGMEAVKVFTVIDLCGEENVVGVGYLPVLDLLALIPAIMLVSGISL